MLNLSILGNASQADSTPSAGCTIGEGEPLSCDQVYRAHVVVAGGDVFLWFEVGWGLDVVTESLWFVYAFMLHICYYSHSVLYIITTRSRIPNTITANIVNTPARSVPMALIATYAIGDRFKHAEDMTTARRVGGND